MFCRMCMRVNGAHFRLDTNTYTRYTLGKIVFYQLGVDLNVNEHPFIRIQRERKDETKKKRQNACSLSFACRKIIKRIDLQWHRVLLKKNFVSSQ